MSYLFVTTTLGSDVTYLVKLSWLAAKRALNLDMFERGLLTGAPTGRRSAFSLQQSGDTIVTKAMATAKDGPFSTEARQTDGTRFRVQQIHQWRIGGRRRGRILQRG